MRAVLSSLLERAIGGSYADVRHEHRHVTEVTIDHRGLDVRSQRKVGGFCRTFGMRGISQCVFSDPAHAPALVVAGRAEGPSDRMPLRLDTIPAPPAQTVSLRGAARVDLERHLPVLRDYVGLARGFRCVSRVALYCRQEWCSKHFANSLGAYIEQEQHWIFCVLSLTVAGQVAIEVLSSVDDALFDEHARIEALGHFAESLNGAEALAAGRYTVVLEPQLAGAVIHETVGHISEADNATRSGSVRRRFQIGRRVAPDGVTVVDDPTIPQLAGSYAFDDEGVAASRTTLIADGIVAGALHSLRTARDAQAASTGNGRASDFGCEPLVRCSNTMLLPGTQSTAALVASVDDGVLLRGVRGGHTTGDAFTYSTCGGRRIRRGRLAESIGNVTIRGAVTDFLAGITAVGDTVPPFSSPFCMKQAQPWMPVWSGSPALRATGVPLEAS